MDKTLFANTISQIHSGAVRTLDFKPDFNPSGKLLSQPRLGADKHRTIKHFQETCLYLLKLYLDDPVSHPELRYFLEEFDTSIGVNFHKNNLVHMTTPEFFRTDGTANGTIFEVQCPGSLWFEYELIYRTHVADGINLAKSYSAAHRFAVDARSLTKGLGDTIVHHYTENASRPLQCLLFNAMVGSENDDISFVGITPGVRGDEATLIRNHLYSAILHENFADTRLKSWRDGKIRYDYPPCAIFEQKFLLALPFSRTYHHLFEDNIREILPYTTIISDKGILMQDGRNITLEDFCEMGRSDRQYIVKYGGSNPSINWGSRSVYFTGTQTKGWMRNQMVKIEKDYKKGSVWIMQELSDSRTESLGSLAQSSSDALGSHEKVSYFYGPSGLYGGLAMHRDFVKVHGGRDTVSSIIEFKNNLP